MDYSPNAEAVVPEPDFFYIPEEEWVYQTPPKQELAFGVEECAIQPALILAEDDQNDIYELNPNIRVDLTGYTNRQNLEVDGRYMRRIASFDKDKGAKRGSDHFEARGKAKQVCYSSYFAQVTCRPSKTVKKVSRLTGRFNRLPSEELEESPTSINLFQAVQEMETSFGVVEEDGACRIVAAAKGAGLKKNLFLEIMQTEKEAKGDSHLNSLLLKMTLCRLEKV
ncbi:hypothetical protein NQ315_000256 [Exocentrus adspersus]|uniref:Uncharacterized protein n=1 Tax=Exocentrus adspersus TaxID=1586481 RepID=A0AAV8VRL8_9CUCU|nr:hypothetical protein NQ315_000256 [Exocentrus adspersus]